MEPSQEENPEVGEGREVLAKQLGGRDMTEEEEEEDRGLAQACAATKRLIKKAIATARPHTVGRSALEFINRREVGEGKNERPFDAKQKASTIKKYVAVWAKMLRYIWRTSSRAEKDRPKY